MKKDRIVFYVCSNGFGHLKRTLLVIKELRILAPHIGITVFCPDTHKKLISTEDNFAGEKEIEYITTVSDYEISWLLPDTITIRKYDRWLLELSKYRYLEEESLVVSDNLVGPLRVFSNAILMGSFLWHSIANCENEEVRYVVNYESNLLSTLAPQMLGVEPMAMKEVWQKTSFIPLPWFCAEYSNRKAKRTGNAILVTGGGTRMMSNLLAKMCGYICEIDNSIEIFTDPRIYVQINQQAENNIKKFSFNENSFSNLSAVVCRPGMGVLTDCIQYNVPPIAIDDGNNEELSHNATRVGELGIGHNVQVEHKNVNQIAEEIVRAITNSTIRGRWLNNLKRQPRQGAKMAASFLLRKLQNE